jgi:hypothetical protein
LDQEEYARDLEDALDDGSVSEGPSHGSCIVAYMLPAQRLVYHNRKQLVVNDSNKMHTAQERGSHIEGNVVRLKPPNSPWLAAVIIASFDAEHESNAASQTYLDNNAVFLQYVSLA